jgi:hypothetical protein
VSNLDSWFGPKEKPEPLETEDREERMLKALVGGSRWNCEERLHSILDAFIEEMGDAYVPLSPKGKRALYASARELVEEVGECPEFVRWACRKAKGDVTIKSLRSLLFLVPSWREGKEDPNSEKARRRYVEGRYADFIEH